MSIRFLCTACNTAIKARPEYANKSVRCPHCKESVTVPDSDQQVDLQSGDDYGLAAMSLGVVEIDSAEMRTGRPKSTNGLERPPEVRDVTPVKPVPNVTHKTVPNVVKNNPHQMLMTFSLGCRLLAICGTVLWLFMLGGELLSGSNLPNQASGTSFIHLVTTFVVGGSGICLLAGFSELVKLLIEIRENLPRNRREY